MPLLSSRTILFYLIKILCIITFSVNTKIVSIFCSMSKKLFMLVLTFALVVTIFVDRVSSSAVLISDNAMSVMVELSSRHPFCKMHTDRYVTLLEVLNPIFIINYLTVVISNVCCCNRILDASGRYHVTLLWSWRRSV